MQVFVRFSSCNRHAITCYRYDSLADLYSDSIITINLIRSMYFARRYVYNLYDYGFLPRSRLEQDKPVNMCLLIVEVEHPRCFHPQYYHDSTRKTVETIIMC